MDGRNHNHAHHHESHVQISTNSLPPANPIDGIVNSLPDLNVHSHGHHHHDHGHAMKMFFHGGFREVILFDFWRTETFYGLFFSLILVFLMAVLYEGTKWFRVYFQLWTSVSQKSSGCISMDAVRGKFRRSQHGVEAALIEKATAAVTNSSASGCNACDGTADDSLKNTIGSQQQVYAPTVVRPAPISPNMTINRWTYRTLLLICSWLMSYISREFPPSTCRMFETLIYIFQLVLAYWLMLISMTFNTYLTAAVVLGAGFGHWLFANVKCAPPSRCVCPACGDGGGAPEQVESFTSDVCH